MPGEGLEPSCPCEHQFLRLVCLPFQHPGVPTYYTTRFAKSALLDYTYPMLPILFVSGVLKIYTMGFFLVLALFFSLFLLWKLIKLTSYREEDVFDTYFVSLFGGLFFARFVYVLSNFEKFGFDFLKFILINGYPGLSLFGALYGGMLTFYLYLFRKKIAFMELIDYFVPPLFLALGIGKIGSFLSGEESMVAIIESVFFFIFAFIANRVVRAIRRGKLSMGFSLYIFLLSFSGVNLLLDNLKLNHLYFFGFSMNFAVSLVVFLGSCAYFVHYFRKEIMHALNTLKGKIKRHDKPNTTSNSKSSQKTD